MFQKFGFLGSSLVESPLGGYGVDPYNSSSGRGRSPCQIW